MNSKTGFRCLRIALVAVWIAAIPTVGRAIPVVAPLSGFTDFAIAGTSVALRPELAGLILYDQSQAFSFIDANGRDVAGSVQVRIVKSNVDSTLDFYWRILNSSESGSAITAFRVGGFDSFALDADWRSDGLGTQSPNTARVFGDGSLGFVNFLFDSNPVGRGQESTFFFLDTQATAFAPTAIYDLIATETRTGLTTISELYSAQAPAAIPEPQTYLMLLAGLGALSVAMRRRTVNKT